MEFSGDELAGVADLFGALTRAALVDACAELAFKAGEEPADVDGAIDDALEAYELVSVDSEAAEAAADRYGHVDEVEGDGADADLLAPGPAAFPTLPDGAADLPHILDVQERSLPSDVLVEAAAKRFREEAVVALRSGDPDFVERLLDVSYELESWGDLDLSATRADLRAARADEPA